MGTMDGETIGGVQNLKKGAYLNKSMWYVTISFTITLTGRLLVIGDADSRQVRAGIMTPRK
jgi:hypothetical protein